MDGDFGEDMFGFDEGFQDFQDVPSIEVGQFGEKAESKGASGGAVGSKEVFKTACISIALGFTIIVISLFAIRAFKGRQPDKPIEQVEEKGYIQEFRDTVVGSIKQDSSKWVEFSASQDITMDIPIKSNFTVIKIKHMAMQVNDDRDMMIKSVVSGNISGLVGYFEIEMAYDKAKYLKAGDLFNIEYTLGEMGDTRLIGDIKY